MKLQKITFYVFLLALLFAKPLYSDSNNSKLNTNDKDTQKIIELDRESFRLASTDPNKGLILALEALKLSINIKWLKGIALANNELAVNYSAISEQRKAEWHYLSSLTIFRKLKDLNSASGVLANLSLIYKNRGDYVRSLAFATEALSLQDKIGNLKTRSIILENIGSIHLEQANYGRALEYYKAAAEIYKTLNDSSALGRNYMNRGIILDKQGNYTEALEQHLNALRIHRSLNNKSSMQLCFANAGIAYLHLQDYKNAISNQLIALQLSKELGNKHAIAIDYGNLGEIYLEAWQDKKRSQKELQKAVKYLELGFYSCDSLKFTPPQIEFGTYLVKALEYNGDAEEALRVFKKTEVLKDSVFSEENAVKLQAIEAKREIQLRENELKIQRSENQIARLNAIRYRSERIIMSLLVFALILIIGVFYLLYLNKIKVHRRKLYEISQMQSHQYRQPVVRILALINELKEEDNHEEERSKLMRMLEDSILDLDKTIHKIVDKSKLH